MFFSYHFYYIGVSCIFLISLYVPVCNINGECLMTSTHFFRRSLFHFEEETAQQPINSSILAPWTSHEGLPTEASKKQSRTIDPLEALPEKPQISKRSSNLLPEKKIPVKEMQLTAPPKPLNISKLRSELKLRGMPIQQFLSQKREEREKEEQLHKKSIAIINESLESSFLARRNLRKRGYSKTIDLRRDLFQPMQIYRSQQVVEITPQKFARSRRQVGMAKYLPIRSERYQL